MALPAGAGLWFGEDSSRLRLSLKALAFSELLIKYRVIRYPPLQFYNGTERYRQPQRGRQSADLLLGEGFQCGCSLPRALVIEVGRGTCSVASRSCGRAARAMTRSARGKRGKRGSRGRERSVYLLLMAVTRSEDVGRLLIIVAFARWEQISSARRA